MSGIWGSRDVPWVPPDFADPDGFVGVGGDLSPATLIRAYSDGVFPWFNEDDPVLWWSPDPRGIIELADTPTNTGVPGYGGLHVSRRLARTIRSGRFRVTFNQCFETVMRSCGEFRPEGTWVTPEMVASYTELHNRGYAHSVETWVKLPTENANDGEAKGETTSEATSESEWFLAGGTYGVSVGGLFAAESMFYRVTDGSKVALAALVSHLRAKGYALLDVQMTTEHTSSMGAIEIPRTQYLSRLRQAVRMRGVSFV